MVALGAIEKPADTADTNATAGNSDLGHSLPLTFSLFRLFSYAQLYA